MPSVAPSALDVLSFICSTECPRHWMSSDTSAALGALVCSLGMLSATAVAMDALGRIFGTGCPQLDLRHWVLSAAPSACSQLPLWQWMLSAASSALDALGIGCPHLHLRHWMPSALDVLSYICGTGCSRLRPRHALSYRCSDGCSRPHLRHGMSSAGSAALVLSAVIDDCVSPLCIVRVWPVASSGAQ